MSAEMAEIIQEFKSDWRGYEPTRYRQFLDRVVQDDRLELLKHMLMAEIEFVFNPPENVEVDEERIRPNLHLLLAAHTEVRESSGAVLELCALEYALRLQSDPEPPRPEAYLELCENSQQHLMTLLNTIEARLPPVSGPSEKKKVLANPNDSTIKDDSESSRISLEPLPSNLGCYLLTKLISRGGMGFVYAAIDLRSATPVAVKVMRRDDGWSVFRFIEEFSWLSSVSHPNLVKLYDARSEGELRYFSMEEVRGRTILEWFNRQVREREDACSVLKKVLAQTASALHFLHENGAVHCDIKYSNVMIASGRRAVLLDLGLAARQGSADIGTGTFQYTAPEVAVPGGLHTRASDWFSFGLMIYEVLAGEYAPKTVPVETCAIEPGRLPRDSDGLPKAKCKIDIDDLLIQLHDIEDRELVCLCCDLLHADPAQRPCGEEILRRLGGKAPISLRGGPISPRSDITAALNSSLQLGPENAEQKLPVLILSGESGIGKTTLVQEWLKTIHCEHDLLLSFRCFRQDQTPLRLLNGLVQELVRTLDRTPTQFWRDSIDRYIDDIGDVFPQVRQLVEKGIHFHERERKMERSPTIESRGLKQLVAWLQELNQSFRFVFVIDDLHFADKASLQWLISLIRRPAFRGVLVGVDDSQANHLMTLLSETETLDSPSTLNPQVNSPVSPAFHQLEVSPLDDTAASTLLNQWCEAHQIPMGDRVHACILSDAQGNPFLLKELFLGYCYHVHEVGSTDDQWLSERSQKGLRRSFRLLSRNAEKILQYLAVSGQPLGFHQLQMSSRIRPHELQRLLNLLESQGWVMTRTFDLESDIEISHEKFRTTVLTPMSEDLLRRRHNRLARMLSSNVPPPWSRIAEHFWQAKQYREAAACYGQALRKAMDSGAYLEALIFVDRAKHPDAQRNAFELEEIARMEAECHAAVGNASQAAVIYQQQMDNSNDLATQREYRCLAGEQWIRAGMLRQGMANLEGVLHEVGVQRSTPRNTLVRRLVESVMQIKSLARGRRLAVHEESLAPFEDFCKSLNRTSVPLTFLDNQLGPELILRLKQHADRLGTETDRALAFSNYSALLACSGNGWRYEAFQSLKEAKVLVRRSGAPTAEGAFNFSCFVYRLQQGQFAKALQHAQRSFRAFSQASIKQNWETQFIQWASMGCYWDSLQLHQLRSVVLEHRNASSSASQPLSQFFWYAGTGHFADLVADDMVISRSSLAHATDGLPNDSFESPQFFLWISRIAQELYEGHLSEAQTLLEERWNALEKGYLFRSRYYQWYALRIRLCCYIAKIYTRTATAKEIALARKSIAQIARLNEPTYRANAKAFELIFNASLGQIASPGNWISALEELRQASCHLYGRALEVSLQHVYPEVADQQNCLGNEAFRREGCVCPNRLLRIILPPQQAWEEFD